MSITLCRAKTFAVLVILGMLLMPVPVALANAAPPLELWLDFEYQTSEQPDLEGVQIIGCDTPECNQPRLLQQYGRCDSGDCLDTPPSLQTVQDLQCVEERCVAVFHNSDHGAIPPFKVVGQFSDRVRASDLFSDELPMYHDTVVWKIAVQDTALSVSVSDRTLQDPYDPYFGSFFQYFALTIVTELLVAALALRVWPKLKGRNLLMGLGYVLLANLISYPVTWVVWPSLGRFQPIELRQVGYFIILVAVMFTALLVNLSRKEGKARRRWVILTLVLLPLSVLATLSCLLMTSLASAYGSATIAVPGLPSSLTVAFAEAFAVSFEAFLLYLLARKTLALSFKQAALISLVMNAASFLAGLVLSAWL